MQKIELGNREKSGFKSLLEGEGLTTAQINAFVNSSYIEMNSEADLGAVFGSGTNENILHSLSEGYTLEDLQEAGVGKREIDKFLESLKNTGYSVQEAVALNMYTDGSDMYLGLKRGVDPNTISKNIKQNLVDQLEKRGLDQSAIQKMEEAVHQVDVNKPLYVQYDQINKVMENEGILKSARISVRGALHDYDKLRNANSTMDTISSALSKSTLKDSMKLYRGMKGSELKRITGVSDLKQLAGSVFHNHNETSTSPLYDSSFAKYDSHDVVFEIFAPAGTKGAYITQFSNYGTEEAEIILNPNDFFVSEVNDVVDKNGKKKTVLKTIAISKDRSAYNDLLKVQSKESE